MSPLDSNNLKDRLEGLRQTKERLLKLKRQAETIPFQEDPSQNLEKYLDFWIDRVVTYDLCTETVEDLFRHFLREMQRGRDPSTQFSQANIFQDPEFIKIPDSFDSLVVALNRQHRIEKLKETRDYLLDRELEMSNPDGQWLVQQYGSYINHVESEGLSLNTAEGLFGYLLKENEERYEVNKRLNPPRS